MPHERHDIIAQLKAEAAELDGDEARQMQKQFDREVEDAKEFFGMWDQCDEVSWALLRAVNAQNDIAHAYDMYANGAGDGERMLEAAFAERIEAITALYAAIKQWPRNDFGKITG